MTIQTAMFEVRLAMAGDAGIHGHGGPSGVSPDVARIAADAILLERRQGVAGSLAAVALFALHNKDSAP